MLEWLRLDGNLIEVLPTATLAPLRTLRGIDLHHNPWNCTCPLRPLRSWLAARNMPFSVPPLCLFPIRLRGQSWNRMPLEELACPPKISAVQSLVQVTAGQQANLSCHVTSNPEAGVSWFFGDRLVVNLTSPPQPESDSPATALNPAPVNQVYYIREFVDRVHDRTEKTSILEIGSARDQDSGFYVCQAANRAETVSVNITLLVKSNGIDQSANLVSRGLTAGLILSLFAVLVLVLLICCICSLKRARLHANMRHRRPSVVVGVSSMNGGSLNASLFDKLDQIDPSSRRHSTSGSEIYKNNHNGSLFKHGEAMDSYGSATAQNGHHDIKVEPTRFPDKQWLVNLSQPAPSAASSAKISPEVKVNVDAADEGPNADGLNTDGHRQIAMYQKVKFNADGEMNQQQQQQQQQPRPILKMMDKICSPISASVGRNYPDLVDLLPPSDYAGSDVGSPLHDDIELVPVKRDRSSPAVFPPNRYFKQHHRTHYEPTGRRSSFSSASGSYRQHPQRRRLSDWEVSEVDVVDGSPASPHPPPADGYDSELESGQLEVIPRPQSRDDLFVDDDFHRRYAYHTGQLNRFLNEYRALQKRLAQMQDTWGRCLDDDPIRPPSSSSVLRHHYPIVSNHHHRHHGRERPLRPILKNRSSAPIRPIRWSPDEPEVFESDLQGRYDSSSVVDELYYS